MPLSLRLPQWRRERLSFSILIFFFLKFFSILFFISSFVAHFIRQNEWNSKTFLLFNTDSIFNCHCFCLYAKMNNGAKQTEQQRALTLYMNVYIYYNIHTYIDRITKHMGTTADDFDNFRCDLRSFCDFLRFLRILKIF